jgi:hypothetical protein
VKQSMGPMLSCGTQATSLMTRISRHLIKGTSSDRN